MATTKGTARKKAPEELIEKAKLALSDNSAIANIADVALTDKDGKINLTKVHDQVYRYVYGKTKDMKIAKEFAVSARWLAMLRRDYPQAYTKAVCEASENVWDKKRHEEAVSAEPKSEPKPKPKDITVYLPGELILKHQYNRLTAYLNFNGYALSEAIGLTLDLLKQLTGIDCRGATYYANNDLVSLSDYLVKILEEKFGMVIRTCPNCGNHRSLAMGGGICEFVDKNNGISACLTHFMTSDSCSVGGWTPKETGKEKTPEICGTCKSEGGGAMAQKKVAVDLKKEIAAIMSGMNGRQGVVSHDLSKIESELSARGVVYDRYDLEGAIAALIKDERIVVYLWRMPNDSPDCHRVALRTLC